MLLFVSLIQHAFYPPGRAGPQSPLPALVSTLATDRDFNGPKGDYAATIAALKQVRPRRCRRRRRAAAALRLPVRVRQEASSTPGVELLFLGDSITESLRGECTRPECLEDLPAAWSKLFAPHHALALGVSGDRTENLLYRLSHGEVDALTPKLTVIEIGTNNLAFGHSAEATALGVQAVVRFSLGSSPGRAPLTPRVAAGALRARAAAQDARGAAAPVPAAKRQGQRHTVEPSGRRERAALGGCARHARRLRRLLHPAVHEGRAGQPGAAAGRHPPERQGRRGHRWLPGQAVQPLPELMSRAARRGQPHHLKCNGYFLQLFLIAALDSVRRSAGIVPRAPSSALSAAPSRRPRALLKACAVELPTEELIYVSVEL